MFLLVVGHIGFNRRFWTRIGQTPRAPRPLINVAITIALAVAMLVLLATSVLISENLPGLLPAAAVFSTRQVHTLAAYWALVIVAIHLGLRWPMLMGMARGVLGISRDSAARTAVLRVVAVAIALHGVWSSIQLGLGGKLAMQLSLDWWNFEQSVAGFFVHCLAIAGLYGVLTYYIVHWLPSRRNRRPAERQSA